MKKLISAALSVFSFGIAAHAAVSKYEVGFNIPYSMPMGDFKNTTEKAAGYGFSGDLNKNDAFAVGIELFQIQYKQKDVMIPLVGPIDSYPGALITSYGLRAKYAKPMDFGSEKGKIYGIFGMGSYSVLDAYAAYDAIGSGGVSRVEVSGIGFNIGGGVDVELAPQWLAGFELRYHKIKDYSILNPALKITYTFGQAVEPKKTYAREEFTERRKPARYSEQEYAYGRIDSRDVPEPEAEPETDEYQTYLDNADNYIAQRDYTNARQEYAKALINISVDDNRRVYLYERQGYMAVKEKNVARAKNYYLAAIGAAKMQTVYDKHAVNAYSGLAYCFEKTGNIPLAVKNYEKALELTADDNVARRIEKTLERLRAAPQDELE